MEENEKPQVFDGFAAEQGAAKYGLCRNAANAARYAKRNSFLLAVIAILLMAFFIKVYNYDKTKDSRDNWKEEAKAWKAIAADDPLPLVRLHRAGFDLGEVVLMSDGVKINIIAAAEKHNAFRVVSWCLKNCNYPANVSGS